MNKTLATREERAAYFRALNERQHPPSGFTLDGTNVYRVETPAPEAEPVAPGDARVERNVHSFIASVMRGVKM